MKPLNLLALLLFPIAAGQRNWKLALAGLASFLVLTLAPALLDLEWTSGYLGNFTDRPTGDQKPFL